MAKIKEVIKNMGVIFKNMGASAGKIMKDMEKADQELQEKMNKAMGSASNY